MQLTSMRNCIGSPMISGLFLLQSSLPISYREIGPKFTSMRNCIGATMLHGLFLLFLPVAFCTIISPNSTLTYPGSWTSSNGDFSIGFFSLQPNTFYVGIWYTSLPLNESIIWTANRNQSVSQNSRLQFTPNGVLQLLDSTNNSVVWFASTAAGTPAIATQAEMMDTGNFVLRSQGANSSTLVWQSFDQPSDTLLPDQNFSASNPQLMPWKSSTDPTPSQNFSLVFENATGIRLLYQSSLEYWLEKPPPGVVYRTFRLNSTGSIALYDDVGALVWANFSCGSSNSFTKVRLDVDGNLRVLAWSSGKWNTLWRALYLQCDVSSACGDNAICDSDQNIRAVGGAGCPLTEPTDSICFCPAGFTRADGNCRPDSPINCSQFMTTMNDTKFGVPTANPDYQPLSQQDCENNCLKDCTCKAATYQDSTFSCWLQRTDLFNGRRSINFTRTSYIRTIASAAANSSTNNNAFPIYAIVLVVASSLIAIFMCTAAYWAARSRWRRGGTRVPLIQEVAFPDMTERIGGPRRFSFQDLHMATEGFSEGSKLGSGGFGTVYKGAFRLPNSPNTKLDVAIKRLIREQGAQGDRESSDFLAEVEILASIRHNDVVNLLGYCAEGSERLLVYEFVSNGSLDNHLFSESKVLDWNTRFQIAVGAATGIEYLHTHCPKKIVHRDIKPANILIDEEFRAKVADFGVSQIMGPERTHLTNYAPGGTPTYMAPECWMLGAMVTEKADAYSFGVVVLEIVSGKRIAKQQLGEDHNCGEGRKKRVLYFQQALQLMEQGRYGDLVDERLEGQYSQEDVERLVKVAFWCLQGTPNQRPSMEDLLLMIKGHKEVCPPPLSGLFEFSHGPSDSAASSSRLSSNPLINSQQSVINPEQVSTGR